MSALTDAISAENTSPYAGRCGVRRLLAAMSKADAAELSIYLADTSIAGTAISRALARLGHKVTAGQIQHHRRGECACAR